jgi:glycosyltransferase involved in cell wall biosynthesis
MLIVRINAFLSWIIPNRIVINSSKSILTHRRVGFDTRKFVLIKNGFPTQKITNAAEHPLQKYSFSSPEKRSVGMVARFDPQKNHLGFIKAAKELMKTEDSINFVLIGSGMDYANTQLTSWIDDAQLTHQFHLLGHSENPLPLIRGLDLLVLPSFGEGFPNVIGEAMILGTPCVATNVGECEELLSGIWPIVESGDAEQLAHAIKAVLSLPARDRQTRIRNARARISDNYNVEIMAREYEDLYRELI